MEAQTVPEYLYQLSWMLKSGFGIFQILSPRCLYSERQIHLRMKRPLVTVSDLGRNLKSVRLILSIIARNYVKYSSSGLLRTTANLPGTTRIRNSRL